jgi:hypothetical protein
MIDSRRVSVVLRTRSAGFTLLRAMAEVEHKVMDDIGHAEAPEATGARLG